MRKLSMNFCMEYGLNIDIGEASLEGFPIHTHEFHELVIVTEGTGIHSINGYNYQVTAGDVFVLKGNDAHGYEPKVLQYRI